MLMFLKRNRFLILISLGMFSIGVLLGSIFQLYLSDIKLGGHPNITAFQYAKNNLTVMVNIVSGFFLFGLPSIEIILINGFLVGFAINNSILYKSGLEIVMSLIPHGIFEVSGFIIACTVGLKSAEWCIQKIQSRIIPYFKKDILIGILSSFVLICIGSVVEAHVTPLLIDCFTP